MAMARLSLVSITAALLLAAAALPAAARPGRAGGSNSGTRGKVGLRLLGSVPFPAAEQVR